MNGQRRSARGNVGGPGLLDLLAVVVGYGLAAMALRAFWPGSAPMTWPLAALLILAFVWLGLAMSGPFVLLMSRHPRTGVTAVGAVKAERQDEPRLTRAETAWLLIGGYWLAFIVFVAPLWCPGRVSPTLGLFPVGAAGLFWLVAPRRGRSDREWTHTVALGLLVTWPVAWLSWIALSLEIS